jgi:hypothetical protein
MWHKISNPKAVQKPIEFTLVKIAHTTPFQRSITSQASKHIPPNAIPRMRRKVSTIIRIAIPVE